MPQFSFVLAVGFFASLGLPGLNSFWSEFMVFVGTYSSPNLDPKRLIVIPLISIVVTAAYYVYTMQRILFGETPAKLGHPHDLLPWERLSYGVLVALVFLVGFFPLPFLGMINAYTNGALPWLGGL
jgi:NADH-quinone oxidoreductase subunit M